MTTTPARTTTTSLKQAFATRDSGLTRRSLLARSGAAAAGLAAAGSLGLTGMASKTALAAQDGGKEYHLAWGWQTLDSGGHFNSFVTNAIIPPPTTIYGDLILAPFGMFYWDSQTWLPLLAESWAFIKVGSASGGGEATPGASPAASPVAVASPASGSAIPLDADTLQVVLRQGVKWSDGSDFTAKDVIATMWCLRLMSNTVWDYIDRVDALDDYTVNFHMSVPSTVVERYVIRASNPRPASVFGEWADKAKAVFEAGKTIDDPETKQLLDEFTKFRPDDVPVTGPYMFDIPSITEAQMTLVKNEQSYFANTAVFDSLVNFNGETDTITPIVLAKEIDYAGNAFPPAVEKQMVDEGIRILRPPTYSGPAVFFNFDKLASAIGDKRSRQAFAHAFDRGPAGYVALADSGVPVQAMTGMSDNLAAAWLPEATLTAMNHYEFDQEKAAALLQEAAWTQDGDAWKTPDGASADFELSFPAEFADWSASAMNIVDQLTDFGIKLTPRSITYTQQPIDVNKGAFEMAIRGWGSSSNPHPHFSYVQAFFTHNTLAVNDGGKGMDFPLEQETETAGKVNLEQLTIECARGLNQEQQEAQVETIAKVFNELLPIIPIFERFGNNAALEGVRVKAWPADDDPILKNSFYADGIPTMLIYTGKLEAV